MLFVLRNCCEDQKDAKHVTYNSLSPILPQCPLANKFGQDYTYTECGTDSALWLENDTQRSDIITKGLPTYLGRGFCLFSGSLDGFCHQTAFGRLSRHSSGWRDYNEVLGRLPLPIFQGGILSNMWRVTMTCFLQTQSLKQMKILCLLLFQNVGREGRRIAKDN